MSPCTGLAWVLRTLLDGPLMIFSRFSFSS